MSDHFADTAPYCQKLKVIGLVSLALNVLVGYIFSYFALDLEKISHINALMSKIKNNEDMACFGRETDNSLKSVGGKCK